MANSDKYHYLPKNTDIIKESLKASGSSSLRLKAYKHYLQQGLTAIVKQFHKGTSINQLLKARSALIDQILVSSWRLFEVSSSASLIAVGGYGRNELQPYSDIDILVLYNHLNEAPNKQPNSKSFESPLVQLEAWVAFLWDIGLELGHSVRTLSQCKELAIADITVATNLLESRYLCGDISLNHLLQEVVSADDFWSSDKFYQAKVSEQRQRHAKFKDTSFNLEPNIKSNPGGLRDLQVMQWISLKHFKTGSLHHLISQGIFTRREYRNLLHHHQFLNKVRFALHAITNKREDRLLFEHQPKVAQWLGFEDDEHKLAVEKLMQPYYRAVMSIRNLNDLFVQIFEQEYITNSNNQISQQLDDDFIINNQRIGICDPELFVKKPWALIKIFTHIALDPSIKQIQATTIRKIRSSQQLVNKAYLEQEDNLTYLKEFLARKQQTSRGFALMKRTNILGAIIPLFANIEGQMQFDLFHAYTVDEHTLFLLRHIIRYNKPEQQHEFPLCSQIMNKLTDHTAIHLAAIFHDIAKGRGGDHSELGAIDAKNFCDRFTIDQETSQTVAWLVKQHLIMSLTAQRKDISDPEVIANFAQRIPSINHLELLYVLTVSDIRATNPTLWNSWKESLLRELFLATKHYLSQQTPNANQTEKVQDNKQQTLELASQKSLNLDELNQFIEQMDDEYLLRYHPEQILWHFSHINPKKLPSVAIKNHRSQAGTEIAIGLVDQANIFAAITAILSQNHLNIQAATLYTSPNKLCIDTFIVLDENGQPLSYQTRIDELRNSLTSSLADLKSCSLEVNRALPTRLKHFQVPTNITFSHDSRNNLTILELSALDRPALLAKMGQAFIDCGVRIHSAKIVTLGEKVEDTFIISKHNNQPISDPKELKQLEQRILQILK